MSDRPAWRGQRPWYEIWFAVLLDESRRRAVWVRQTFLVPHAGEGRTTVWGAWFDADDPQRPARAAKRYANIDAAKLGIGDELIRVGDDVMTERSAVGSVSGLAWDLRWSGGREAHAEVPTWLPLPTHTRPLVYDGEASGTVVVDGVERTLRGRANAMHMWGKRRMPTLQWIWAPALSLEVQALSLRDTFSLGIASLRLDSASGETLRTRPATAAHPTTLVTATSAGARRLIHARAWAEPAETVGYAYRDTDGRDVMVAQSDIGSAALEVFTRSAPGGTWKLVDDRRVAGGVAVEIHQHAPLPDVSYLPWDATTPRHSAEHAAVTAVTGNEEVPWPEVRAIVALGLTYGDHARETGQKLDPSAPPTSFTKHVRAFAPGDGGVRVPTSDEVLAALDGVEPGIAAAVRERIAHVPPVLDYEGELALVALGAIDEAALARGEAQPFGVAAANDLTSRFCQVLGETMPSPLAYWTCAKSFERFLPVAERVWAPAGGLARLPELALVTRVNGGVRQQASTKLVMYDLVAIARAARAHFGRPLERGDVVLTGTPAGVGHRMSPLTRRVEALVKDRFRKAERLISTYATSTALLRPGDVIEVDAGPAGRVRTRLIV